MSHPRILLAAACLSCTLAANAARIVDPMAGAQSGFFWEAEGAIAFVADLGVDDGVTDEAGTTDWTFAVAQPSLFGMSLSAYNRPPTAFDLWLDGAPVSWTQFTITPEQIAPGEVLHHSDGLLVDALLAPGWHSVTLAPSHPNTDGSVGLVSFWPLQPVPEPDTALLLGLGLLVAAARAGGVPGLGRL